jgi:hypothetical protein
MEENRWPRANMETNSPVWIAPRITRLIIVSVWRKPVLECTRTKMRMAVVGIRQGPFIRPVEDDPPVMSRSTMHRRASQPEGRRRQLRTELKRKVGYW